MQSAYDQVFRVDVSVFCLCYSKSFALVQLRTTTAAWPLVSAADLPQEISPGAYTRQPTTSCTLQDTRPPEATARLHVFMRGVMWRSAELNSARVWHQISQSWAIPFAPQKTGPAATDGASEDFGEQVTSHKGITDMAQELCTVIWQHLREHQGELRPFMLST